MNKTDIEILLGLTEILESHDTYTGEDYRVYNGLERVFNEDKWITIKGKHILLKDEETPQKAIKRTEIKSAISQVASGEKEEILIKDVRKDLKKYGGDNNIAIIKGNLKGGAIHISNKHEKDINGIIDALLNGKVTTVIKNRKIFLETNDYLVILQLDYFGNKKTWLLTGYFKEEQK